MALIEVYYEENANLGNYESSRVGLTIKSDKVVKGEEEIAELTEVLLSVAKGVVRSELEKIKNEKSE